tara:strand:+ start:597 stop:914 length:318 start_codon:yes stop_codon:yes gene_type:complete
VIARLVKRASTGIKYTRLILGARPAVVVGTRPEAHLRLPVPVNVPLVDLLNNQHLRLATMTWPTVLNAPKAIFNPVVNNPGVWVVLDLWRGQTAVRGVLVSQNHC